MSATDSPFEEVSPNFRPAHAWRVAEDEPPPPPKSPAYWRRVRNISLGVTVVLLVLISVWFFTRPHTYHQVTQFGGVDEVLVPCMNGFLFRESPNVFVLHDWVRGAVCWRAVVNAPFATTINYSVSPNGRFFAVLAISRQQLQLQTWDNGKLSSDMTLTNRNLFLSHLKVMDDDRVFVWPSDTRRCPALLLKDGTVIARGRLIDGTSSFISPDGSAIICPSANIFEYGAITVRHGQLILANRYYGSDPISAYSMSGYNFDSCLFNNGLVLANNGAVYGPTGKITNGLRWEHDATAPGGSFTYEHLGKLARVVSPLTGQSWSFTVSGFHQGGDATADGRFALAWFRPRLPQFLRMLTNITPMLDSLYSHDTLALYERPGHLRAVLRMELGKWWGHRSPPYTWWWYPSPDGHAIAFTIAGRARSKCLLFRW